MDSSFFLSDAAQNHGHEKQTDLLIIFLPV